MLVQVARADAGGAKAALQASKCFLLLLLFLLQGIGGADCRLKLGIHLLGRCSGGRHLLAHLTHLCACGVQGLGGFTRLGVLLPPTADVLLLGVQFLQALAGGLQALCSLLAALVDLAQGRGGLVYGIEQHLQPKIICHRSSS
ncbi:hypothetical protein D3C77_281290 [compost metagenome]